MKKLLSLVFIFVVFAANGQERKSKYQPELQIGYVHVLDDADDCYGFVLQTVQGIRLSNHFSLGLGTGVELYKEPIDREIFKIPIYLNTKYYLNRSNKITGYISLDAGTLIEVNRPFVYLFYQPAIGIKLSKLTIDAGYRGMAPIAVAGGKVYSALVVRAGILF